MLMQLRRPRWSCACLLRLAWNRTRRMIYRSLWGPSVRMSSRLAWESSADSSPRAGPSRNGADTERRYPELHKQLPGTGAQPVGSGEGRFAFEMPNLTGPDRQLPPGPDWQLPGMETRSVRTGNDRVRVCSTEPNVSGTGQALTGYRDTAGEAGIRPIRFLDADPDVSEIRETATGYRDTA